MKKLGEIFFLDQGEEEFDQYAILKEFSLPSNTKGFNKRLNEDISEYILSEDFNTIIEEHK